MLSSSSEEILSVSSSSSSLSRNHNDGSELLATECIDKLKALQIAFNELESQYFKSVYEFEYEFYQNCSYLFEKRAEIINGKYEPNEEECRLQTDFIVTTEQASPSTNDILGIPMFWLQTLKQVDLFNGYLKNSSIDSSRYRHPSLLR